MPNRPLERTKPLDWEFLLDQIRDETCLLILGQEVFADDAGLSAQARLLKHLGLPDNNPHILRHYADEDFFLFEQKHNRTSFCHDIKKFYRNEQPGALLGLLADLPFHIYLTVTPDTLLSKAFADKNFKFQHGYYKKNTEPQPIAPPTAKNPLLYNLFGCVENEESLVLSHDDLYDYFKSIFKRESMPGILKDELKNIRNILFLGVSFDKWYLQILLRELDIHLPQSAFKRFAANQSLNEAAETLCIEQFQIQFVPQNVREFVLELHQRAAADKELHFRVSAGPNTSQATVIKNHVAKGETSEAIDQLLDYLDGKPQQADAEHLSGRFNRFRLRRNKGILSHDELTREENSINDDLLQLLTLANS